MLLLLVLLFVVVVVEDVVVGVVVVVGGGGGGGGSGVGGVVLFMFFFLVICFFPIFSISFFCFNHAIVIDIHAEGQVVQPRSLKLTSKIMSGLTMMTQTTPLCE